MDLFKLDPGLAIWTWITFGIVLFILAKFVIPSIMKNLQEREDYIHSAVDKTAEVEQRLQEINNERNSILRKANNEADQILQKTREDAEQLRKTLTSKAEAEAKEILEQAKLQIAGEKQMMYEEMQEELADLICSASEKVVGLSFTSEKEKEFTRELVKKL